MLLPACEYSLVSLPVLPKGRGEGNGSIHVDETTM